MTLSENNSCITTAVRIRPFSANECKKKSNSAAVQCPLPGIIRCNRRDSRCIEFSVDHTFSSSLETPTIEELNASQKEVYETLALPLLEKSMDGLNTCLFAFGVTSSGKTHSMHGSPECPGIVPRIVSDLFARTKGYEGSNCIYKIKFSYFEIYNEKIYDLLSSNGHAVSLMLREDRDGGTYIQNLTTSTVTSAEEVYSLLRRGEARRKVAETAMNSHSSRSHSIVTFYISKHECTETSNGAMVESVFSSKLNLVDLAGCERQTWTSSNGERLSEACQINKSLFTLGLVISQLSGDRYQTPSCKGARSRSMHFRGVSETRTPRTPTSTNTARNRSASHVSFRDSVLTRILKDSLGGNSVTTMLATISPSSLRIEDTISTLQYAIRAKSIVNRAVVNEDPRGRIIRELRKEVDELKKSIEGITMPESPLVDEIRKLRSALASHETTISELRSELDQRISDCARFHINAKPGILDLANLSARDLRETPMRPTVVCNLCNHREGSAEPCKRHRSDSGLGMDDIVDPLETRGGKSDGASSEFRDALADSPGVIPRPKMDSRDVSGGNHASLHNISMESGKKVTNLPSQMGDKKNSTKEAEEGKGKVSKETLQQPDNVEERAVIHRRNYGLTFLEILVISNLIYCVYKFLRG